METSGCFDSTCFLGLAGIVLIVDLLSTQRFPSLPHHIDESKRSLKTVYVSKTVAGFLAHQNTAQLGPSPSIVPRTHKY